MTPQKTQQVPCGGAGSAGRRPLVAVLLLLFIYRSSQMRRRGRALRLGCQQQSGGDLAPPRRPAERRSSQRTEGERDRAICGTDVADTSLNGARKETAGSTSRSVFREPTWKYQITFALVIVKRNKRPSQKNVPPEKQRAERR